MTISDEDINLNRKHFIEALRNPPVPQICGSLVEFEPVRSEHDHLIIGYGKPVAACAVGVAQLTLNPDLLNRTRNQSITDYNANTVGKLLGDSANLRLAREIISMNDDQEMSFDEIADVLERRWGLNS